MAGVKRTFSNLIMHQLIFATANQNKAKEIQAALPQGFEVLTMKEAGVEQDIPEPFFTLEENAATKAQTIYLLTGQDCFAEDTGLEVEALHGAPGVHSARFAGEPRSDERNIQKLVQELQGQANRNAQFRTVMTLMLDGKQYQFEGSCKGTIIDTPRGNKGFGYDPVFIPEGSTHTFAEMGLDQKNQFSHRKKALMKMIEFLKTAITEQI
jgi:XTP/dITP diphosphohydrolase